MKSFFPSGQTNLFDPFCSVRIGLAKGIKTVELRIPAVSRNV